ncbi:MAG: DUF932 domain-containing protein [Nanoarchaeota archaeon]|nr:DUF932 domain-containing protein [Nanoarchaeota archaeon]
MSEPNLGMAELKLEAMNFDRAEMRDLHVVKEAIDGEGRQDYLSKHHMGVWNVDKHELACLAPKSYMVIQQRHATESIIEALTSLNIKATAMLKKSRHGIQLDLDFPDAKFQLSEVGESFTSGVRIISDYSQVAGLVISPRITRLVCSNGMIINEVVRSKRIKYSEELKVTVEGLIDQMLKDIISSDGKLAGMVSACMRDSIEWQACQLLARALFKQKKHVKQILSRLTLSQDSKVNRWQFYNAITEYCTRGERLKPALDAWLQNKAQKVLTTPFIKLTEELLRVEGSEDVEA